MLDPKVSLRYAQLVAKYGYTILKKEYAEIFKISVSAVDKYIAKGGVNLAPFKKNKPLSDVKDTDRKDKARIYWDTLDVAIFLESALTNKLV